MKNLITYGIFALICASGCGDDAPKKRSISAPVSLTDPALETIPRLGANPLMPASYTMIDTPDANLCVDAFIRKGITLPDTTVARTLDATSWKSNGIAISDLDTSTIPILNIVHLKQECSNVMFQFYNKLGYYCIVKNISNFSDVKIQKSCSAQMTEIEPITHDSQGSSLNLFWFWPSAPARDPDATTGAYNSRITQLPCVP